MNANTTVQFDKVSYIYSANKKMRGYSLDDITFSLTKGDILAVIGHNGAGKSTILKLIANLLVPMAGRISVNGSVSTLLSLNSGQILNLSGRENVIMSGLLMGQTKKEISQKMGSIIEFSQLSHVIDNPLSTYSAGMRARLSFSTLVHVPNEILLLDEIFSVGDTEFKVYAKQKMLENISTAKTTIIVSHNMEFLRSICNKAIWLDQGKLKCFSDPETTIKNYEKTVAVKLQANQQLRTTDCWLNNIEMADSKESL